MAKMREDQHLRQEAELIGRQRQRAAATSDERADADRARALIGAPKRPGGPDGQDDAPSGAKIVKSASSGKQRLAEVVEEADEEPADEGALEAAEPADDHDHEGEQEDLEVRAGIDAEHGARR
mgnify:CR=1 FL=1